MDNEIQLISDGDGLAVIGDPTAVELFLVSQGLASQAREMPRFSNVLNNGAAAMKAGSAIAEGSGRWVQLTAKSAQQINQFGLMKSSTSGLSLGVVQAHGGKIKGIVEFANGPGSFLANPAILAGAAGIMAQLAMKQSMDEITAYLATIDEKVDDLLRAQKDAVFADMIGVDLVIDEALIIREKVGRVSEVTWSKVQSTTVTVVRTQAYALRQLDAIAEKLERKSDIAELAKASKEAEKTVREWLAVLARCFQLLDAISVLELDRVFDASPDDLDRHRIALRTARQNRLELITRGTERMIARMDAAAGTANAKVLLHPVASKAVVASSNFVSAGVVDFQGWLGIESSRESLDARRWRDAAVDAKDKALETGAEGVELAVRLGTEGADLAGRLGTEALDRAKTVSSKISAGIAERLPQRRK
jgi:hypothetical protein